jgi:hypothetical protein
MLFGVLITQSVSVLGVLPVFAYLVIPAVAGAFLFTSVRARLIFGWTFASVISLIGLETARLSQLDPGPTIVCLFAGALVLLGVGLFLRARRFGGLAILQVVGGAVLFTAFLAGTLVFRKAEATDELATAIVYAKSAEPTQQRQAMVSFRKFPDAKARWVPLVVAMLGQPDPVTREAAATLLGETRAADTVAPLGARLAKGVEPEDGVRESVVRSLRAIGDPHAVPPLVEAAARDDEADLAVAMATAAFELAAAGQDAELRRAGDVLVHVITDTDAPGGARRDAGEALRAHIALGGSTKDDAAASAWWHDHRDTAVWQAPTKLFVAPAAGG